MQRCEGRKLFLIPFWSHSWTKSYFITCYSVMLYLGMESWWNSLSFELPKYRYKYTFWNCRCSLSNLLQSYILYTEAIACALLYWHLTFTIVICCTLLKNWIKGKYWLVNLLTIYFPVWRWCFTSSFDWSCNSCNTTHIKAVAEQIRSSKWDRC